MEHHDDPQLRKLLHEWRVPDAPASLDARGLGPSHSWWRFLLTGQIRVPVPVGLAVLAALIWMTAFLARDRWRPPAEPVRSAFNLKDFQPVQQVEVRVIRRNHANE